MSCFADAMFWFHHILNYVYWSGTEGNLETNGWVIYGLWEEGWKVGFRGWQELREKEIVHFVQKKRMRHDTQVELNGKRVQVRMGSVDLYV